MSLLVMQGQQHFFSCKTFLRLYRRKALLQLIQWLFSKKTYHSLKFSDVTMNSSISSSESSIKGMKAYLNKKQGVVLLVCLNLFNVQFTPEPVIPGPPLPSSGRETPVFPLLSLFSLPSFCYICLPT